MAQIVAHQKEPFYKTSWFFCLIVIAFAACIAFGVAVYWDWQSKKLNEGIEKDTPNFEKEMQILQSRIEQKNNQ